MAVSHLTGIAIVADLHSRRSTKRSGRSDERKESEEGDRSDHYENMGGYHPTTDADQGNEATVIYKYNTHCLGGYETP